MSKPFLIISLSLLFTALASCASAPSPSSPALTVTSGSGSVAVTTQPWTFRDDLGEVISTPNYRIYTTVRKPILRRRLPTFLEAALNHYRGAIVELPAPSHPMETFVMSSRIQWQMLTISTMGDRATPYLAIERGGFAADGRGLLWDIGVQDTLAIAAHEGWHQYTQSVFRDRLPPVFEEGIAAYSEGYSWQGGTGPVFLPWKNLERFDNLREAHATGRLMSLPELLTSTPADLVERVDGAVLVFYAQTWALMHFLAEGADGQYRPGLESLISDAQSGKLRRRVRMVTGNSRDSAWLLSPGPAVFAAYFNADLAAADSQYRDFIEQVVSTGSKNKISVGLSPIEP